MHVGASAYRTRGVLGGSVQGQPVLAEIVGDGIGGLRQASRCEQRALRLRISLRELRCLTDRHLAAVHSLDQFGLGVVDDGLGLAVGCLVAEAGALGCELAGFLALNIGKIFRKYVIALRL